MGTNTESQIQQLVTFRLGDEEYGVDILKVHEIDRMMDITEVPNAPPSIEGVINLRGKVIPVINLRKKFNLPEREADGRTKIVVVDIGTSAGMIVDSVSEVLRISSDIIEPPPPMTAGVSSEYIRGVGKLKDRLLILLDIEKLLGADEKANTANAVAAI
ncbi:MAG: chemotaxis protein CheW [Deltaproteobacteria bacterium]|nr:chemotaxis protein CheW [Deltaproteobacteria bacterium]